MANTQPPSPPKLRTTARLTIHATAFGLAGAYFAALFLFIPVATEARDYVFNDGFLSLDADDLRAVLTGLIYPLGQNSRLVSMAVFAVSHHACGLSAPCLNAIQIGLLLAAYAAGAWHLQQLVGRALPAAIAMLLWAVSAPVFSAGYWQATQHDKLAFTFSLSALALGLSAMRRNPVRSSVVTSLALLGLFMLAMNAKEMAFFLPAAAAAQVLFLAPGETIRQRLRAGIAYAAPFAYAAFYIAVYLAGLHGAWKDHVLSGNLPDALIFYAGSLTGRHPSPGAATALIGALAACSAGIGRQLRRVRPQTLYVRTSLYLLAVAAASTVLAAPAQIPSDYYMMVPQWALLGWIALTATAAAGSMLQCLSAAIAGALAIVFMQARYADYRLPWGAGQQLRDAHRIYHGYGVIRATCGAGLAGGLKLVFSTHPAGAWWYFRGLDERPDQLVGAYIWQDGQAPPMAYSFDGNTHPDHPGQTIAVWSNTLAVTSISKNGVALLTAP